MSALVGTIYPENFGHITTVPPRSSPYHIKAAFLQENRTQAMGAESATRKDSLRVEKVSGLALILCVVVLVCLLVFRPF